jgi:hypothetical protein
MTLFEKLSAKGIKVYQSTPLFEVMETIDTIKTGDNCVVMVNKFDKPQLAIQEGTSTVYISLLKGVDTEKDSYELVSCRATRDYESVTAGDMKVFAR